MTVIIIYYNYNKSNFIILKATLVNKSKVAPVKVNNVSVNQFKVLNNGDRFEVIGKVFQYCNDHINKQVKKNNFIWLVTVLLYC